MVNRIWREANLMTTILETIYLIYESDLERDETQLSVPHVNSKIHIFSSPCLSQLFPSFVFCQNYRHETYFSHCCNPNWPHRNIQTTSESIWLLSITEHLFFSEPLGSCREKWIQFSSGEEQPPLSQFMGVLRVLPRAWEHKLLPRASRPPWECRHWESKCRERCLLKQYLRSCVKSFGAI